MNNGSIEIGAFVLEMEDQLALIIEAVGKEREHRIDALQQYLKGLRHGLGVQAPVTKPENAA